MDVFLVFPLHPVEHTVRLCVHRGQPYFLGYPALQIMGLNQRGTLEVDMLPSRLFHCIVLLKPLLYMTDYGVFSHEIRRFFRGRSIPFGELCVLDFAVDRDELKPVAIIFVICLVVAMGLGSIK